MLNLKRNTSNKSKKTITSGKCSRFLISINVLGSTGPIRFVVNEDDLVCEVMKTTLVAYARQARLPALGTNVDNFILYCVNDGVEALSPRETIGRSKQVRHFLLCKKQGTSHAFPNDQKTLSNQMEEEKRRNSHFSRQRFKVLAAELEKIKVNAYSK
ncbi:uncharacterized protein LOC111013214 [Momordica charantia]|uniref:Uncharacterized protein LOC111013214 n=1 Tax=Momordica charantia TaxID=3673 RepID=A0A6J1CNZ1_MOMCH|nr:uncharacterized protein LOC111013214 [Momordica charantia]